MSPRPEPALAAEAAPSPVAPVPVAPEAGAAGDVLVVVAAIPPVFRRLLLNPLVTGVTSSFLWFALTFWVYLETRSVVATGIIGGAFSITSAVLGPVFGTFVDRHRKSTALTETTALSVAAFAVATVVFVTVGADDLLRLGSPWFWVLVAATLLGAVAGQMRAALCHVAAIGVPEAEPERPRPGDRREPAADVRGALEAIRAVPGLGMLIVLAAFNNLLAGVFMALMDPYGLELVSVETWGLLWGGITLAFIAGGLAVARYGLGPSPVRVVLAGNLAIWSACSVFALRSSVVLVVVGMVVWLGLIPVIEAAEQTVLQRSIPYERQGRVFGFAQLVENAASPLTAFLVAPVAEAVFMPFMTDGRGADWIGGWFGTGPDRGIALLFTVAGLAGVAVTFVAWTSRSYRRLATPG